MTAKKVYILDGGSLVIDRSEPEVPPLTDWNLRGDESATVCSLPSVDS